MEGNLKFIIRRKWVIILAVIISALVTLGITIKQQPLYKATAVVEYSFPDTITLQDIAISNNQDIMSALLSMEIYRAINLQYAAEVARKIGNGENPESLLSRIQVDGQSAIGAITVTAIDTDPQNAAILATQYAQTIVNERDTSTINEITKSTIKVKRRLNETMKQLEDYDRKPYGRELVTSLIKAPKSIDPNMLVNSTLSVTQYVEVSRLVASYNRYADKINELDTSKDEVTNPLKLFSEASVPKKAFQPETTKNTLTGMAAGLVLGLALAFMYELSSSNAE